MTHSDNSREEFRLITSADLPTPTGESEDTAELAVSQEMAAYLDENLASSNALDRVLGASYTTAVASISNR